MSKFLSYLYGMSENITNVSDETFDQEILQSNIPTLIDFWAEWCGPCVAIAPILDELASEYKDRIKICKLNIDHNQASPIKYGVRGIPTMILFKDGQIINQIVGLQNKQVIADMFDKSL